MVGLDAPEHLLLIEADGPVLTITINRPGARNAIDRATSTALQDAFEEFEQRADLSVVVLTGAGGTFCAGMDLKAFARGESAIVTPRGFGGIAVQPPSKPAIAAIEGFALGGGLEIALACDLIVAAENATLGVPEVRRGITANAGALLRLPRRVPHQVAMEMILTGEPLSAARAAHFGLVNRVTPAGGALAAAREMAAMIAANAPLALAASKRVVVESADWTVGEAFSRQEDIVGPVRRSADAAEGARAFAEKRAPVWRRH